MLEVLFSKKAPKGLIAKVIPMFETSEIEGTFLTPEEGQLVQKAIKQSNFKAKSEECVTVLGGRDKIILLGLGMPGNDLDIQKAGQKVFRALFESEKAYFATSDENTALNLAFGVVLGGYTFDKYKTEKKPEDYPKLEQIILGVSNPSEAQEKFKPYVALATGIRYCKDLCNEPASYLTPSVFASDIKRLEYLGLEVEVLDAKALTAKGLRLVEAVGKGAKEAPKVVVVSWRGNRKQEAYDLGLIGKGICFDSGGLSLKTNAGMAEMKMDMAGAAAVVSALKVTALQRIRKNIIGIVGLAENMPDGGAMHVGDVYASYSGKTVEVMNTDAEGRLILADCLSYMQKNYKVKKLVDISTLGSLRVVLGNIYAGLFSNDEKLAKALLEAGKASGELLWQMPLNAEYKKMLTSSVADICNVSVEGKASIVSAAFLESFIEKGAKWAHIDMSGLRLEGKKLSSGFGVRVLNELIKGL